MPVRRKVARTPTGWPGLPGSQTRKVCHYRWHGGLLTYSQFCFVGRERLKPQRRNARYDACRYLPWRAAKVVQVVRLKQVVRVSGVVFLDGSAADESPEQVAGAVAGGSGQRHP
jgi:hypothetical protein